MAEIQYSSFLNEILTHAERMRSENNCQGMSRNYIVAAALRVLERYTREGAAAEDPEEVRETAALLEKLDNAPESLEKLLSKWRGQKPPITETIMLSTERTRAQDAAKSKKLTTLPANLYLQEILRDETDQIKSIHKADKPKSENSSEVRQPVKPAEQAPRSGQTAEPEQKKVEASSQSQAPGTIDEIAEKAKTLQNELKKTVRGQDNAVNVFAAGYFQSELQSSIDKDRRRPSATFLFAGPPGVGKTFLSEESARLLGLPFKRFDMSEYSGEDGVNELAGSDQNYKASSEGQLTGFVEKNPHCIVLIDEVEKSHLKVIHLFLQILDAGRLRDNRTDKEVDFKDTIIIFTTNAGKILYEGKTDQNLSSLQRDVILDALSKDVDPRTNEPYFPAAICSRFASGNVVMFNYLDAHTLHTIISDRMDKFASDLESGIELKTEIDRNVSSALLLAEGASADARRIKGRVESFFGTELFELYRLLPESHSDGGAQKIRSIRFRVDLENADDEIRKLFMPSERIHALVYSDKVSFEDADDPLVPVFHYVHSFEEAKKIVSEEPIRLIFCDLFSSLDRKSQPYLNLEDFDSPARDFMLEMLSKYPEIPFIMTETPEDGYTIEEKNSYLRRGIRGFISLEPYGLAERIRNAAETIFQQSCMTELARRNCLVRYETAQTVSDDGTSAEVILFDMKLEKAVKAEDSDNVLSLLSTPDLSFDDVIGADSAKNELRFFIQFMKDPKKAKKLQMQPKGILLYGPPGTGKTMLARAFAAESKATFIATEGNRFLKKWIGEGEEMMHQIFAAARRYAPSVIFIDEIDIFGSARTGGDTDFARAREGLLTALFTEMDGFAKDPSRPVFVVAATNYGVDSGSGMQLDAALLRRFDNRILVDLPTKENRILFLEKETAKKPIFHVSENGIRSLADRSTGMSLALLTGVLDMAVRTAMLKGSESISDDDLDEAFEQFNGGDVKKWSAEVTLRTARHEAGHTLISWLAGEKPSYVTIVSRGNHGGYMQHENQEDRIEYSSRDMLNRIRTALGGRAAEIVYYGKEDGTSTGAVSDLKTATDVAAKMICLFGMDDDFGMAVIDPANSAYSDMVRRAVNGVLKEQMLEAIRLITENRDKLDRLVDQLIRSSSLQGHEIEKVLSE